MNELKQQTDCKHDGDVHADLGLVFANICSLAATIDSANAVKPRTRVGHTPAYGSQ